MSQTFHTLKKFITVSDITKEAALRYHEYPRPGKIEVKPTKPYSTQRDLALAYSPGVAYPCLEIEKTPTDVYKYTDKGNLVAVISNGTAVLGLGDIGALAGKPVMEGKALLFKIFAGLDCFDIEVDEHDPDKFIEIVKAISPTFGGINLEDIKAPECFEIERRLKEECNIPVMHDDQHGTAIISGAGLLNALEIQKKDIKDIRLVVNGAGAAAISCTRLYMALGVQHDNIVMCDSKGVIRADRPGLSGTKAEFATTRDLHTLAEAMVDADVFLGLSVKGVLTPEMVKTMAPRPIVFALANPDPEIDYDAAMASRPDIIVATGRSDYPNQINNVLGFPYIFRGALDVQATAINETMKIHAVHAIADLARQPVPPVVVQAYGNDKKQMSFGRDYILPKPLDPRLLTVVAPAVARGAMESGVARRPITDWQEYDNRLVMYKGNDHKLMRRFIDEVHDSARVPRIVVAAPDNEQMLRAAVAAAHDAISQPILLGDRRQIEERARQLGLDLGDILILNPAEDTSATKLSEYARVLRDKLAAQGLTEEQAVEKLRDNNLYALMMVEQGDADAVLADARPGRDKVSEMALQVIGTIPGVDRFATLHILDTTRGTYFLSDTMINCDTNCDALYDIARLTADAVRYFAHIPVMAMVSHSNFGSHVTPDTTKLQNVVERLHSEHPDLAVDGEMQIQYALNRELRDKNYPDNALKGREVNTLIFPNLSAADTAYRMILEMGVGEAIGPVQIGLKKPVHFIPADTPARDIYNMFVVASLDALK